MSSLIELKYKMKKSEVSMIQRVILGAILVSMVSVQAAEDLPKTPIEASEQVEDNNKVEECSICYEDMKEPNDTITLSKNGRNCGHTFHSDCISRLVHRHNFLQCPKCRTEINILEIPELIVSIKDLIDDGTIPQIVGGILDLSDQSIASLDGLKDIPGISNVTCLNLTNNKIENIQVGMFMGLDNLERLNLYNNKIENIQAGALTGLDNLERLDLSSNKIENIERAFTGLDNLRTLNLYWNKITNIQAGAFTGLDNLRNLNLYSNNIENIQVGVFANLNSLGFLDLSSNNIENIQSGAFTGLDSLRTLYIDNNKLSFIDRVHYDFRMQRKLIICGGGIGATVYLYMRYLKK